MPVKDGVDIFKKGSPRPVLTPGIQNVRRKMVKWNRRKTEWIPSASGCGKS